MFIYATCMADPVKYTRFCWPGINRCAHPDSPVIRATDATSIATTYNEILEYAAEQPDLEALVLLHEDVELLSCDFEETVRSAFAKDPKVGLLGIVGARNVRYFQWWEDATYIGQVFETRGILTGIERSGTVEVIDGLCMVLSPEVVRNLRFDESYPGFHGYDIDFSFQVREAGYRVEVINTNVAHFAKTDLGNVDAYKQCGAIWDKKWGPAAAAAAH